MSLENAQYIHQLIPTNPTVSDKLKQGDDHIRMGKRVLLNTFPNIQGPVLASHTTLNNIPENLAQTLAALVEHLVPKGTIIAWDLGNNPTQ